MMDYEMQPRPVQVTQAYVLTPEVAQPARKRLARYPSARPEGTFWGE